MARQRNRADYEGIVQPQAGRVRSVASQAQDPMQTQRMPGYGMYNSPQQPFQQGGYPMQHGMSAGFPTELGRASMQGKMADSWGPNLPGSELTIGMHESASPYSQRMMPPQMGNQNVPIPANMNAGADPFEAMFRSSLMGGMTPDASRHIGMMGVLQSLGRNRQY